MGSITNCVLSNEPVAVAEGTSLVPLRVPWYRSLPLSALEHLKISLDGDSYADDEITLVTGGVEHPFAELKDLSYDFWYIQDTAWARVPATPSAQTVALLVEVDLRIPYLMIGPDRALVRHVVDGGSLPVAGQSWYDRAESERRRYGDLAGAHALLAHQRVVDSYVRP